MAAMACILPVVNAFPLPKKTVKPADCFFWQNWLFRVGFFSDRLRVSNSPSAVRCLLPERFCLERIQSPAGHSNPQRLLPFRTCHQMFQTPPNPKRNSPAQAPGRTGFAIQCAKIGGSAPGRSGRGPRGTGPCPSTNTGQPTSWTVCQTLNDFPGGLPCGRGCQHLLKHFTDTQKPRRPLRNRAHPQTS